VEPWPIDALANVLIVWVPKTSFGAQTQRLLANPIDALPWHPMVLHRGGRPDAGQPVHGARNGLSSNLASR
jgi:hypothetical protein